MSSMTGVMNPPDFLSVREAAQVLRIGRTCAYAQAREFVRTAGGSGLPVVRVGRLFRVPRVALEDLLGGPLTWPIEPHSPADDAVELKRPTHKRVAGARRDDAVRLFPV